MRGGKQRRPDWLPKQKLQQSRMIIECWQMQVLAWAAAEYRTATGHWMMWLFAEFN